MNTPAFTSNPRGRPKKRSGDRHKPGRQVRVRGAFLPALDALAERNATSTTEEVNRFIRESLERAGLWPPPAH
jgi:hypothetical protein